jgi:hypothetical protein
MNVRKLIALTLVLGLLLPAIAAAAPLHSAPLRDFVAGPCVAGAAYDPACDVDHDGDVDISDVQKTAGHWNQSGVWLSDNNHNHLGQTWTGASNPLKIQGAFGAPDYAGVVLSNTAGHGLAIPNASVDGIYVGTTGFYGMVVNDAALDGVYVNEAGNPSSATFSNLSNGFEVAGAQGYGLYVGRADASGVHVKSAGFHGVDVTSTSQDGVYVDLAGRNGVNVDGNNLAGYFAGPVQITGGCTGCLLATFGLNAGDKPLAPGDVVSLAGLRASGVDSVPMLMEVRTAAGGDAVVGVVQGWAELVTEEEPRPTEIGLHLVPREGPASPGQYVTIAYSGLTQVKVSGPITQGSKLAVGTDGAARALRTVNLDGVELAENASVIGVALESLGAGDGLVWVLVNPQ